MLTFILGFAGGIVGASLLILILGFVYFSKHGGID